jgi:hypothetical protein
MASVNRRELRGGLVLRLVTLSEASLTVSNEGTLRLFTLDFMPHAGSDLIPRRDILIPRFVFRGPSS